MKGVVHMSKKKINKFSYIISAVVLLCSAIFVLVLYLMINKETEIILNDQSFEVKGLYGATYSYNDITMIELKNTLPKIISKTNGADWGHVKKGFFDVTGLGNCKLYVLTNNGPYLYLKTKDNYVIINYTDKNKTNNLYNNLLKYLQN